MSVLTRLSLCLLMPVEQKFSFSAPWGPLGLQRVSHSDVAFYGWKQFLDVLMIPLENHCC